MALGHQLAKLAGKLLKPIRAGDHWLAIEKMGRVERLDVTSPSFADGDRVPSRHAGEQGVAPALAWGPVPPGTRELVLLVEDPDAPFPRPFVHWLMYGIPAAASSLPEGLATTQAPTASGGMPGKNSTGRYGYTGPRPPPGHGVHRYHFQVFAVDRPLALSGGADRDAVEAAMQGHVLASGEVVGTYEAS